MTSFKALVLDKKADGSVTAEVGTLPVGDLPEGDVLVRVSHSTLNYKDAMILHGLGNLVKTYPHVPGIDCVGTVTESNSPDWRPGDQAILTGWRVGEIRWGGYAELCRLKSEWLVPLPKGMTPRHAMTLGTAGFTAMLAVMALEDHGLKPGNGDVLVTGASGGVGSVAVAILADLGYRVMAASGRPENEAYLKELGAADRIERKALAEMSEKPLESERWAGAVDTVGGTTLARILKQLKAGASVAACGLVGGSDLPASVIPFLLRGVNLLGIDSVLCPMPVRRRAWERLAEEVPAQTLEAMTTVIPLAEVPACAARMLKGETRGRIVIAID